MQKQQFKVKAKKKNHLERKAELGMAEEGKRSTSGGLIATDSTDKFDFALGKIHFFHN